MNYYFNNNKKEARMCIEGGFLLNSMERRKALHSHQYILAIRVEETSQERNVKKGLSSQPPLKTCPCDLIL